MTYPGDPGLSIGLLTEALWIFEFAWKIMKKKQNKKQNKPNQKKQNKKTLLLSIKITKYSKKELNMPFYIYSVPLDEMKFWTVSFMWINFNWKRGLMLSKSIKCFYLFSLIMFSTFLYLYEICKLFFYCFFLIFENIVSSDSRDYPNSLQYLRMWIYFFQTSSIFF